MMSSRDLYITNILFTIITFFHQLAYQVQCVVDGVDDTIAIPVFPFIFRPAFKKESQTRKIAARRYLPVHDPVNVFVIAGIGLVLRPPPKATGKKPCPDKFVRMMPQDIESAQRAQ